MKKKIGIIFGGRSSEHEISLLSARTIIDNLNRDRYSILPIAITREGNFLRCAESLDYLVNGLARSWNTLNRSGIVSDDQEINFTGETLPPNLVAILKSDLLFPILHGTYGEDGRIQGFLDMLNKPYVGCGVPGSSCCMDKDIAKNLFLSHQLPTAPFLSIHHQSWNGNRQQWIAQIETSLTFPIFVKPANMGSSIGIHRCESEGELQISIEDAFQFDSKIIVENGVDNCRELEIALLGNENPESSIIGEIKPEGKFYDYYAKYKSSKSSLLAPAPNLTTEQQNEITTLAKKAFAACCCQGLARVDMLLDEKSGKIYLNEINTMPGFTSISMYPLLWQKSGVPISGLLDRLITLAGENHEKSASLKNSYDNAI